MRRTLVVFALAAASLTAFACSKTEEPTPVPLSQIPGHRSPP